MGNRQAAGALSQARFGQGPVMMTFLGGPAGNHLPPSLVRNLSRHWSPFDSFAPMVEDLNVNWVAVTGMKFTLLCSNQSQPEVVISSINTPVGEFGVAS